MICDLDETKWFLDRFEGLKTLQTFDDNNNDRNQRLAKVIQGTTDKNLKECVKLNEAGVEPDQVKWIIIEAGYEKRSERNQKRQDTVPAVEFDRFAADGGDLEPDQQSKMEEQGTIMKRVSNDHDDIERFRADIIAAFTEMFLERTQ